MSASSSVSRSAARRTGPVVAAIVNRTDLPLVLVAAAQAEHRRAALVLVHVTRSRWRVANDGTCAPVPHRAAASRYDPSTALRDRALTLAHLSAAEVTWTAAIGRPDNVVARLCRDNGAGLIIVGASRRQLATWRRRRVFAAARRLQRRANTPIHIVTK
jgi:Universal stress protein family